MLALNIFRAGLDWRMVRGKWPGIRRAFDGFDVQKVARYDASDVDRLMSDPNVIRNRRKIEAVVYNAAAVLRVTLVRGLRPYDRGTGLGAACQSYDETLQAFGNEFGLTFPSQCR